MTMRTISPRRLLGLAIVAGVLWLALHRGQLDPVLIENAIRGLGPWGPAAHVVLFALGTVLFVPGALFGLAGGVLFGPFWGSILNLAGATLGATAAFLAARSVAADWVRKKAGALMGLGLLAAVAFVPRLLRRFRSEGTVRWIEVGELAPRLAGAEDIAVIDVRGLAEFSGPLGHIANARNVPLPELSRRVAEFRSLTETPVVLVCKTDKRSASAAVMLDAAGFQDVFVLRGGMVRWNQAGFPIADR